MSAQPERFASDLILLERLAAGGMADVFRAQQTGYGDFVRVVAVKRVLPQFASDEEFKKMFQFEVNLCARFSHPNIAQVFRTDEAQGYLFLVMEFIDGKNIAQLQRVAEERGIRIPVEIACFIIAEAAKALDYAHDCHDDRGRPMNVIHRDISPQNIMISYDGNVKVVDFGIARAADRAEFTDAGIVKGKVPYMSPEQAKGDPIDRRTDVFALGVVFHELLTQRRLFKGDNRAATMDRIARGMIAPPSSINPTVGAELDQIVLRALMRNPNERFASAKDLLRQLTPYMNQHFPRFLPTEEMSKFMKGAFAAEIAMERRSKEEQRHIDPTVQTPSSGGRSGSGGSKSVKPDAPAPRSPTNAPQGPGKTLLRPLSGPLEPVPGPTALPAAPGLGGAPGAPLNTERPFTNPISIKLYTDPAAKPQVIRSGPSPMMLLWVALALAGAVLLGVGLTRYRAPAEARMPTLIPGVAVWYRADQLEGSHEGPVGAWRDSSPSGVDAVQMDPERQPTLNKTGPNYLPVVVFDGKDDFLVANRVAHALREAKSLTAIYVARSLGSSVSYVWSIHEGDKTTDVCRAGYARGDTLRLKAERDIGVYHDLPGQMINAFTVTSAVFGESKFELYVDGALKLEDHLKAPIAFPRAQFFSLGQEWDDDGKPSDFFRGELAELVFFSRALTPEERRSVELYLAKKYGLAFAF